MKIKKILKKITGIEAIQNRKEAKNIKEHAEQQYTNVVEKTEHLRKRLNRFIEDFGKIRLETLRETVGRFVAYLRDMRQKSKINDYDFLEAIDIKKEEIKEFDNLELSASQILKGTAATAAIGAAALSGVPVVVTSAVTATAAAGTGTAISSLSGIAAQNAVLAWLGGGTLAAGGGGVAAGAAVLSAITWATTGGLAILTAGLIASAHYSQKLTEAKEYEKSVDIEIAKMEKAWVVMDGIEKRVSEMRELTKNLRERSLKENKYLAPLIPDFDVEDSYYIETFQRNALLVKSIADLSKTPIIDENGDLSEESGIIATKIRTLLDV